MNRALLPRVHKIDRDDNDNTNLSLTRVSPANEAVVVQRGQVSTVSVPAVDPSNQESHYATNPSSPTQQTSESHLLQSVFYHAFSIFSLFRNRIPTLIDSKTKLAFAFACYWHERDWTPEHRTKFSRQLCLLLVVLKSISYPGLQTALRIRLDDHADTFVISPKIEDRVAYPMRSSQSIIAPKPFDSAPGTHMSQSLWKINCLLWLRLYCKIVTNSIPCKLIFD